MEIEELLNNIKEKGSDMFSNTIEEFMETLKEKLKNYELKENLQKKYLKILKNDETIEYNVFSKISGKDYTIISFEDRGQNIIKIPNLILPKEINSRTVLNYKNGEFTINKQKTEIKNNEWKKKQETEEILKEGRIYFVDDYKKDYTKVIAIDNGKTYKFNFMEPYIGSRLKTEVGEGEYIVAKDGKFEKFEKNINIKNNDIKEKIKDRIFQIKEEKLNSKKNVKEEIEKYISMQEYKWKKGEIYIVTGIQEDKIKMYNIKNSQELIIKSEKEIDLEIGDFIKTKNIGYERYDGIVNIDDKTIKENLYNLYNFIL